ncbi:MAG: ribbon-helix-helix domain-containing protein [Thermofilum sp.]
MMSSPRQKRGSEYVTRREDYTAVTRVISVKLPVGLLEVLDELIERGYFQNRSDAIREAIRKLLASYRDLDTQKFNRSLMLGIR